MYEKWPRAYVNASYFAKCATRAYVDNACCFSRRRAQTRSCLPEPGEAAGLEEVLHGAHDQRVLLGAHHLLDRGE
jgi:hypothetical protein